MESSMRLQAQALKREEKIFYYNVNSGDCLRLKSVVTSVQKSSLTHFFLSHSSS